MDHRDRERVRHFMGTPQALFVKGNRLFIVPARQSQIRQSAKGSTVSLGLRAAVQRETLHRQCSGALFVPKTEQGGPEPEQAPRNRHRSFNSRASARLAMNGLSAAW